MESEKEIIENKDGKQKSIQFPAGSLSDSLEMVKKIAEHRGEQVSKLKDLVIITGIPEGSIPLPISTACQYGILENVHGSGYKVTQLYSQIISPVYEIDKSRAIHAALSSPALYKMMLGDFNGRILPNEKGLVNYLNSKGFKSYAIPKIIKSFNENFKEYIETTTNKLRFLEPAKKENGFHEEVAKDKVKEEKVKEEKVLGFTQPIPLPNGKMISLTYPKGDMSADDFAALKAFISFLELSEKRKENE